ncbi:MAG UNVERIFIED_CONTAM: hypothetical protein LVT10_20640 [Anaerolineae bacterium]|jgi:hypothetical protein
MQPNHVALNAFEHVQAHRRLYKVLLGERGMAAVWQRIQAYMFTYAHRTIRTVRQAQRLLGNARADGNLGAV